MPTLDINQTSVRCHMLRALRRDGASASRMSSAPDCAPGVALVTASHYVSRPFSRGEPILTAKQMTAGLILIAALALSACNTVRGMGRDVQSVGKTVEGTAQ